MPVLPAVAHRPEVARVTHTTDPDLKPSNIKVYEAIVEATQVHGVQPSKQELALACMLSVTSVQDSIAVLRRKGYIHAPKHQIRALRPTDPGRTLSREPPDPWAALEPKKPYFTGVRRK